MDRVSGSLFFPLLSGLCRRPCLGGSPMCGNRKAPSPTQVSSEGKSSAGQGRTQSLPWTPAEQPCPRDGECRETELSISEIWGPPDSSRSLPLQASAHGLHAWHTHRKGTRRVSPCLHPSPQLHWSIYTPTKVVGRRHQV